jgi:tRNA A37 methylthiotransferase MiaB
LVVLASPCTVHAKPRQRVNNRIKFWKNTDSSNLHRTSVIAMGCEKAANPQRIHVAGPA